MAACIKSLAGHDLYVGRFYFRNRYYKAALGRFKAVLMEYPDVGLQHDALKYIAICEAEIARADDGSRDYNQASEPPQDAPAEPGE